MRVLRMLYRFIFDILNAILRYLPGTSGIFLRKIFYSKRFRSCGKQLRIGVNVVISGFEMIDIGDNVEIKDNAIILTAKPKPREIEKRCLIELSDYTSFEKGRVVIGGYSRINYGAMVLGYGGVRIGKECGVGINAKIISESNHYKGDRPRFMYKYPGNAPQEKQSIMQGVVVLERGAALATNAIALPASVIGKDSWVSPNSVVKVKGNIPPSVIVKGDPAEIAVYRTS